jgi:NAD(P)H-dependent FMN reductase
VKALLLNGAVTLRDMAEEVYAALESELRGRGFTVVGHDLSALDIPDCLGDFGCWTATPGTCVQPGPHREIARDLIQSDLAVWLTPITFGGYSSALKRQLDHCIPLVSPWFTTVEGETHHQRRYERFPDLLAVGLMDHADPLSASVFDRLVRRNAINMHVPRFASAAITSGELPQLVERVPCWLDEVAVSRPPAVRALALSLGRTTELRPWTPRRALILVGSPRGQASVSATLGGHLAGLLVDRGLIVEAVRLRGRAQADPGLRDLATRVALSDVVVLATPLYVDSLPALVTEALELLARQRRDASLPHPRLLAIVNCGFPESVHNDTALAICRIFAEQAGLDWMGGLGVGAGGMLAAGRPLDEQGGRARYVTRALAMAANAVVEGLFLPEEACQLAGRLAIPRWAYRLLGDWGFRREASKHGVLDEADARPYMS